MTLRAAEQVANAVLYEGYVLYPYRASAPKNRLRWQVGLVAPRLYSEATGSDSWFTQTECLAETRAGSTITVRARALHLQQREVEQAVDGTRSWRAVQSLVVDGRQLIEWDEAVVVESVSTQPLIAATPSSRHERWAIEGFREEEIVCDRTGRIAARLVRHRNPIQAVIRIETERHAPWVKIRIRVENETATTANTLETRDRALRDSLAGLHVILTITNGAFVSLLDPPAAAAGIAATCANQHTFPVLVGAPGTRDVLLSSPIILYDYPAIAPESGGDMFDATEIDELLTLRVQTLTDEEKQEARATDPRAAEVIDRCEAAGPDTLRALHGAVRHVNDVAPLAAAWQAFLNPPEQSSPEASAIDIGGVQLCRGARVRLSPRRHADSMDICLRGRLATVAAVYRTLENTPYVAVTLDDDPFGAGGEKYRRSLFFHPDELEPLADQGAAQ